MNEQAGTGALFQPVPLQIARHGSVLNQQSGGVFVQAGFTNHNLCFEFSARVPELNGNKALPSAFA